MNVENDTILLISQLLHITKGKINYYRFEFSISLAKIEIVTIEKW